ncbi:MAG: hypothetical protein EOO00_00670 [Chitinophagaceae bacterium]|nr:MAG: hypothetical protein EOO00_00670 [Chitinophagaceae bacterium]
MHTTNYQDTFIEVAEDCPVTTAEIPVAKNGKPTIASMQYDIISKHPYKYTSDDVVFNAFAQKNELTKAEMPAEKEKFFSKGQPCLRASPLTKRYGWGVHSDAKGRVAIYGLESKEYEKMSKDKELMHLKGMRSKKA